MIRILLAEDQAMVRGALSALLGLEPDLLHQLLPVFCFDEDGRAVVPRFGRQAADAELGVDADLGELAPRPQREILAVAAAAAFEGAGMLPDVALVKQLAVGRVLAALQPFDDVVEGVDAHRALAREVVGEGPSRAGPEGAGRHRHPDRVPGRFATQQPRGEATEI